jgi:hypothetical protein
VEIRFPTLTISTQERPVPSRLATITVVLAGVAALVSASAGVVGAAPVRALRTAHPAATIGGPFIRANGHETLPLRGGSVSSANWSGYAVTPTGDVTAVSSTFIVPTAGLVLPGFAASWAGIGGYSSQDLIQAGVAEDSFPTNPLLGDQYFAWYELLPGSAVQLTNCTGVTSCAVSPGDSVTVHIFQTANDVWTIDVSDSGHWSWSRTGVAYTSTHSSAEWILEAPQVDGVQSLIAGVGTAHFGPLSTFTVGAGSPQPIAAGGPTQINLTTPLISTVNLATPSALAADGQSFNVCAYATSCATP